MRGFLLGAFVSIAGFAALPAVAADLPSSGPAAFLQPILADEWIVTVKGNFLVSPKWNGADSLGLVVYPSISFRRPGDPPKWSSPDDGIDYTLLDNRNFQIGPVVRYQGGRYDGSDNALRGIHNVPWTLEPGIFGQVWLVPDTLRARVELRHGIRRDNGFVADIGFDWLQRFGAFTVAVGPRMTLGDARSMRDRFGVTAQDAINNPLVSTYRPGAGLQSIGAFGSVTYQVSPKWAVTGSAGYARLVSDASSSPIVRRIGTPNQFTVGLSVAYSFAFKGF
jgi:outer membrane scaffolding protein for murein synthesis (MipA/OmpV family)